MGIGLRPIAFYLPQFHQIPENNEWWGKGFTEWSNVVRAKPLFKGHYQPHLPADLGFYDLRLPEARQAQADLARAHGIYGFCYYHYWFSGRRLLERPFDEVLRSGQPDFPFMLCWANHNWTRVWDDLNKSVLLRQEYSPEDDVNHIRSLIPAFKDRRYITVEGKPVFCIYRSNDLPEPKKTISIWREEARKEGLELYLCRLEGFAGSGVDFLEIGLDAAIEVQPFSSAFFEIRGDSGETLRDGITLHRLKKSLSYRLTKLVNHNARGFVIDYKDVVERDLRSGAPGYKRYPGVAPMWDNSARRKSGYVILRNSTPELYERWLREKVENFTPFSAQENFMFINSMNEWAEGNHLEPCQRWGRSFLEATSKVLLNGSTSREA